MILLQPVSTFLFLLLFLFEIPFLFLFQCIFSFSFFLLFFRFSYSLSIFLFIFFFFGPFGPISLSFRATHEQYAIVIYICIPHRYFLYGSHSYIYKVIVWEKLNTSLKSADPHNIKLHGHINTFFMVSTWFSVLLSSRLCYAKTKKILQKLKRFFCEVCLNFIAKFLISQTKFSFYFIKYLPFLSFFSSLSLGGGGYRLVELRFFTASLN